VRHVVVGTAGHIDHGKTSLVKALTGTDTDRLPEEKARGITIDLGFAHQTIDGVNVAFVDVPGHERFVHTMVAGASGIDFALLVVAADDGIMPQTLEHLAIIDLLGQLRKKLGFSMIFISHDLSIAAELADRMITMYAGTVVERASVTDLFYRPRHPYSVGLLRAVPRVSGALGSVASIPGSPPDLMRLPVGCSYAPRCPYAIDACRAADPPLVPVDTPKHQAACIRWKHVAEILGSDAEVPVAEKLA